ncbi:50S ribosomal protein L24 [Candidatus Pacearchaeota archaeon]|nr:50S ribosomal protein L24 [Candidatus Pacearchaeota archaeon]
MPICSFCGIQYEWPRGLTLVSSTDGRITYFCSSKCRRNAALGRDKKKVRWVVRKKEEIIYSE